MLIEHTAAFCYNCGYSHKADLIVRDNQVVAIVRCPKGDHEYSISSNAAMFLEFRNRSFTDIAGEVTHKLRYVLNYIPITNACNFNCTICGADAKYSKEEAVFFPPDTIFQIALQAKRDGGYMINLTGGEPTLHPDLLDIVRRISAAGISLGINTNGYLLGKDNALASSLKQSGLNRVIIQFDSFNEDVLRQLGRNYLSEKRKAIKNAVGAGLRVCLNSIVTKHNLPELGRLLAHGLDLGSAVINIAFASPAPTGRYLIPRTEAVDREQMVSQLLKAGDSYHFSLDDFLPLPTCIPWGIQVHPDCGIHVIFVRTPHFINPLNRYIDMKKLYKLFSRISYRVDIINKYFLPFLCLTRSVRKEQWFDSLKIALGLLFAKQRYSVVNVGLSNYAAAEFLDEQRIRRCAAAFYTPEGPVKGCLFAFLDEQSPCSLRYNESHRTS